MAILGPQIVFSMIMASMLSKFSGQFSFGRWILCGKLARYLHPTDEELRKLAGISMTKNKGSKKNDHRLSSAADKNSKDDVFAVPKNTEIQLESVPIKAIDLLPLQFYFEYQWMMDFAICGLIIYSATELYYAVFVPTNEINLSMMWCILVISFCIKIMFSLTAIYFRAADGGEMMLCIVFGFFFLVMAMGILIVGENSLEFGLESAYTNFTLSAASFFETSGMESEGSVSMMTVRIVLALVCSVLGAFLTFPGLRLAKMHTDALKYTKERPFYQILLHVNIVAPLLVSLMWVRPVFREYLVNRRFRDSRLLTDDTFDILRLCVVLAFCLFRFFLIWTHLQSHLNMACDKVLALKKEVGRISSVELKQMIIHVYYYLCVVALQYVAPLVMLLFCTLMLKNLGDFSVSGAVGICLPALRNATAAAKPQPDFPSSTGSGSGSTVEAVSINIYETASQFPVALSELRNVFTPTCFRGLLSFFC